MYAETHVLMYMYSCAFVSTNVSDIKTLLNVKAELHGNPPFAAMPHATDVVSCNPGLTLNASCMNSKGL
jgi:hypothetical protein